MRKSRILVVEDNPDNLELVRLLLDTSGYEVLSAEDGLEGFNVARQQNPDLILLDLSMPGMDGWSAARKLKSDPETKHIPLVALTAHTLPGDRRRALEAGCDGYISKPINVASFIMEIDAYLRMGEQGEKTGR